MGKNHHTIDTFVEAVKKDIECTKTFKPKRPYPNLDTGEKEAIKELSRREDIIITKADKGGAVVIVDTNDYIKEAVRQLNDKDNFFYWDSLHASLNSHYKAWGYKKKKHKKIKAYRKSF